MSELRPSPTVSARKTSWMRWGFMVGAGLYLLLGLKYPLISVTETRAAEVAREILVSGDWATLQLNFEPYYDKPPLLYWLCALSFQLLGVNEFAARLIPALASYGSILLTLHFASRWFGPRVGLLSGVVLFLSAGFIGLSRLLVCDPLFTFFFAATLFTGYEAIRSALDPQQAIPSRVWMLVCGLACGLGLLTKGPVIGILCGVPFVYAVLVLHRGRKLNWIAVLWAVLAFGLVVVPWFVWTASVDPLYLAEFLLLHNLQRFSGAFHEQPFWYFLPVFIAGAHPWSALSLPFIHRLCQRRPFVEISRPAFQFLLLSGVWCILFFSLSRCKLPTYILPAAVPLAISMAIYLVDLFHQSPSSTVERLARVLAPGLAIVATLGAAITYQVMAPVPWSEAYGFWGTTGIFLAFLGCAVAMVGIPFHGVDRWWAGCAGFVFCFYFWINHCLLPNVGQTTTCFGSSDAREDRARLNQVAQVIVIGKPFYDAMFYAQRTGCRKYEKPERAQLVADLRAHGQLAILVPPHVDLEAALGSGPWTLRRTASHPRYRMYEIESTGSNQLRLSESSHRLNSR